MIASEIKDVLSQYAEHLFSYEVKDNEDGCLLSLYIFDREYSLQLSHAEMREGHDAIKEKWMQITSAFFQEFQTGVNYLEYQRQNQGKAPEEASQSQQQQQSTQTEPCESENLVGQDVALASPSPSVQ